MASRYELWLCNDAGTRIADRYGHTMLERVQSFTATRIANDIGTFTAIVPSTFDQTLLKRDQIIQVWRAAQGASLKLFQLYFLRRWTLETKKGKTSIELHGLDPNDLLRRRIVRAPPNSQQALYYNNKPCDDAMKLVITRAQSDTSFLGAPAPNYGTRAYPYLTVEGNASAAPTLGERYDASYEYILQPNQRGVLSDMAEIAAEQGTPLFFDVVPRIVTGSGIEFIFRTRIGQPGQDLTHGSALFSQERGNLSDCSLTYDYTEEENYIYAVKEDGKYATSVHQDYDAVAHDASIWNRCEGTVDRNIMWGAPYLRSKRGRVNFTGNIKDVAGMRLGVHWNFGDKVPARYGHFQFDTIVKAVTLGIDKRGKETIKARLEYTGDA